MQDARLNRAAPLTPTLLLAPAGCDVPERTPRVLLLVGDVAAALAHPDTNALRVWVRSVTRYDTKLWMRDLKEGAAYLPK